MGKDKARYSYWRWARASGLIVSDWAGDASDGKRPCLTLSGRQAIISCMRDKQEVIDELKATRADFMDALDGLDETQMLEMGVAGIWSAKDIVAHLTAWESEVVTALNQAQGKRVPRIMQIDDIDEWNEKQYHASAARTLSAVLADFEAVHDMLLTMVADYNEKDLLDGRRYSWMEGEPLTFLLEENATLHEREHADDIRAWREKMGSNDR